MPVTSDDYVIVWTESRRRESLVSTEHMLRPCMEVSELTRVTRSHTHTHTHTHDCHNLRAAVGRTIRLGARCSCRTQRMPRKLFLHLGTKKVCRRENDWLYITSADYHLYLSAYMY